MKIYHNLWLGHLKWKYIIHLIENLNFETIPGVNSINVPPNLRDFLSLNIILHFRTDMFTLFTPNSNVILPYLAIFESFNLPFSIKISTFLRHSHQRKKSLIFTGGFYESKITVLSIVFEKWKFPSTLYFQLLYISYKILQNRNVGLRRSTWDREKTTVI